MDNWNQSYVNDGGSTSSAKSQTTHNQGLTRLINSFTSPQNSKPYEMYESMKNGSSINNYVNSGQASGLISSPNSAVTRANDLANYSVGSSLGGSDSSFIDQLKAISDQNNQFNLDQVAMVNEFNALEAQKNRDWQERLSNTAHQREVKDLIAAGLNPVLSAGGQGAYVGSGAQAVGQKAVADNSYANALSGLAIASVNAASAENVARIYANARGSSGFDTSARDNYYNSQNTRNWINLGLNAVKAIKYIFK